MRAMLRVVIPACCGAIVLARPAPVSGRPSGDSAIVDTTAAWYQVHASASITKPTASQLWCGKDVKTRSNGCTANGNVRNGTAREHVEIRGQVMKVDGGNDKDNEIHVNVLLDHTWLP